MSWDGLVGSEHSEYDPAQKPMVSESQVYPYFGRSQLCNTTLQIDEPDI